MVLCPVCESSRIRSDYKPAPLALRIFFIRAFLCDRCNHQFKAFSIAGTPPGSRRHPINNSAFIPASQAVDLARLNDGAADVKRSESLVQTDRPRRLTIDLAALRLQSRTQQEVPGIIVIDQSPQARRNLRTEITRLYTQTAVEQRQLKDPDQERTTRPASTICTHCGSADIKRRHRTILERMAFSVSNHKAFTCRSCGETFYSKVEDDRSAPGAIDASEALR